MAQRWKVPRMWLGQTVAILASGASMSREIAAAVVGNVPTIAINNTFELAPDADLLYACDAKCWQHYGRALAFKGLKVTIDPSLPSRSVKLLHNSGQSGFDPDPANLRTGLNSGYQALHLAVHAGAKRILLLGYDMRGQHWFGDHPAHLQDSDPHVFSRFIAEFEKVAPVYAEMGVDVVNCTPGSALTCFRASTLEAELDLPAPVPVAPVPVLFPVESEGGTPPQTLEEHIARIELIQAHYASLR
jgi:hypothetical protein